MAKASKASADVVGALIGEFWGDRRRSYDAAGNVEYYGKAQDPGASQTTAAAVWEIWKFTYANGKVTRIEGPLADGWTNRAAAAWS